MGGMHIHVGWGVIHTAECGRSGIVVVTDGIGRQTVLSGRRSSSSTGGSRQISGRRRGRGGTRQTGASTGVVGSSSGSSSNRRVRVAGSVGSGQGRLGGSRQAQSRQFVTREQRPFRSVMVVPRDFSRTSGMDLRDRR